MIWKETKVLAEMGVSKDTRTSLHEFAHKQKSQLNSSVFGHYVACCYCKECIML